MKERAIRLLILEDDPRDVELTREHLEVSAPGRYELEHVSNEAEFEAALAGGEFDAILLDYHLPNYDGLTALARARERHPGVAALFVSGTIGEDKIVDLLRAGADDLIVKSRIERLSPAIERALAAAAERKARRRAELGLRRGVEQQRLVASLGSRALASTGELDLLITEVANSLLRDYECDLCQILVHAPERGVLVVRAAAGFSADPLGLEIPIARRCHVATAWLESRPVVSLDLERDQQVQAPPLIRAEGAVSGISVPIEGYGVLSVYARERRNYAEDEAGFLASVASVLGQAIRRGRAEEALKRSEELHRVVLGAISDAVFLTDEAGRLTYVCSNLEVIFARDAQALAGEPVELLLGEDPVDPAALASSGELSNLECQIVDAEGRPHHLLVNVKQVEIRDGRRLYTCRDVTEHRLAEDALDRSQALLSFVGETAEVGVWSWDLLQNELSWSPQTHALYRVDPGTEPTYELFLERVHPEDRSAVAESVSKALDEDGDGAYWSEHRLVGGERWIQASGRLIRDPSGVAQSLQGIALDITERKRAELRLRRSQALEALGQLAGGVAHDFNNMLTVILGHIGLLKPAVEGNPGALRHVEAARSAAEQSSSLTQSLLSFSRRQLLRPEQVDLNEALSETQLLLARLIGEDVDLRVQTSAEPIPVEVDAHGLQQAIMNLAINARHAMPRGGRLSLEADAVQVSAGLAKSHPDLTPGGYGRISVSDTGVGMDAETQERMFEPFFTTKSAGKGTGLGLSSLQGFVAQSNGAVTVDSEVGKGTRVCVYLPLVSAAAKPTKSLSKEAPSAGGRERILVVEDQPLVRELFQDVLSSAGYQVSVCESGEKALAHLRKDPGAVDLLLTDVVMPGMSGRDLVDRVEEIVEDLAVIYTSGYTQDAIGHRGVLQADIEFLHKPVRPAQLLEAVRRVLSQRPGDRAQEAHDGGTEPRQPGEAGRESC